MAVASAIHISDHSETSEPERFWGDEGEGEFSISVACQLEGPYLLVYGVDHHGTVIILSEYLPLCKKVDPRHEAGVAWMRMVPSNNDIIKANMIHVVEQTRERIRIELDLCRGVSKVRRSHVANYRVGSIFPRTDFAKKKTHDFKTRRSSGQGLRPYLALRQGRHVQPETSISSESLTVELRRVVSEPWMRANLPRWRPSERVSPRRSYDSRLRHLPHLQCESVARRFPAAQEHGSRFG